MADAEVGRIIGYLALDRSDWDAELAAAGRKADELARHDPNIKISTNAPTAIAQLAAVAAATRRLQDAQGTERLALSRLSELQASGNAKASQLAAAEERLAKARRSTAAATIALAAAHDRNDQALARAASGTDKVAKSEKDASKSGHELVKAIAAIAPAAVPIGAVATGVLAGMIPVTATVILGIKGITEEFKNGQLAGTQYGQDITALQGEFTKLKTIAAGGLLSGLDQAMQQSQPLFGALNKDIGTMSSQLGNVIAGAAPALLKILQALNPLFVTFGNLVAKGAQDLEHWATSSGGVQSFVAYVEQELPTVLSLIEHLAVLFGHVVQAVAPIGDTILHVLNGIATALDAIPVGVLTEVAKGLLALYVVTKIAAGFKALKGAILGMNPAVAVITAVAVAGYAAGKAINNWIEGGRTTAAVAKQLAGATEEWTQALVDSNGALTENIRLQIGQALQSDGLAAKAAKAGISLSQLIDGVTGTTSDLYKLEAAWKAGGAPAPDTLFALQTLHNKYQGSIADAKALRQDQAAQAASGKILAGVNRALATSQSGVGRATDYTVTSTGKLVGTTEDATKASQAATTALQRQTHASHLLKSAQDLLNGVAQTLEGTTDDFAIGLGDLRNKTALYTDANGNLSKSLKQNTVAGATNRQMLVGLIQQAQAQAQATADEANKHHSLTKALEIGNAQLKKNEDAIRKAADAAGLDKSQVDKLISSLGVISKIDANPKITLKWSQANHGLDTIATKIHDLVNGVYNVTVGVIEANGIRHGGNVGIGRNAMGTMNWRGGLTYLAENGPELVSLPRGSKVYPNNSPQTQAALHGQRVDGRPFTVNVYTQQMLDPNAVAIAAGRQFAAAAGL